MNLDVNAIDALKNKKLLTQVIPSEDLLDNYDTIDKLKAAGFVTVTDPSADIEDFISDDSSDDSSTEPGPSYYTVTYSSMGQKVTFSNTQPKVAANDSLETYLVPNEGYRLVSNPTMIILMQNADPQNITNQALDGSTGRIYIEHVIGNVSMNAVNVVEPIPATATFTASLTNCTISGISSGDSINIGSQLVFTLTGEAANLVAGSISNNGIAYTNEQIGELVSDSGENWFQFTIPEVYGDIVVSFRFENDGDSDDSSTEPIPATATVSVDNSENCSFNPDLLDPANAEVTIGGSFSCTIIPDVPNYNLSVTVEMYNPETARFEDITASAWSGDGSLEINISDVTGDINIVAIAEETEEPDNYTITFNGDYITATGLDWDGSEVSVGEQIDVELPVSSLSSQSRFIDIVDITPDFSVTVTNNGEDDSSAVVTKTGSGSNTKWRIQTEANGNVEINVAYDPVTFNDDEFTGDHAIYTNLTSVDFANVGTSSIAGSFSIDPLDNGFYQQFTTDGYAIPLYTPDGFSNETSTSDICANPANYKGFWMYVDSTTHNPKVCCVTGTESNVSAITDFSSFDVLSQTSEQAVDVISQFNNENFDGDINEANFFFEDLRAEISGSIEAHLFYDKSN